MKVSKEVIVTVVIAVISLIISGYTAYTHNDKELTSRVVRVETQQQAEDNAIIDIKTDVREMRADVKDLVKWALGDRK